MKGMFHFLYPGVAMKNRRKFFTISSLFVLFLMLLGITSPALATDDVTPFFAGRTGSPNVMILFDNSNSMQDSPYFMPDGNTYKPSTYWRRGVTINEDCNGDGAADDPCIAVDTNGHPVYDQTKYVNTDTELTLPGQNPPNLPGLSSSDSSITSFQSSSPCPAPNASLTCSDRIYDANVDWSLLSTWSDFVPYRYWKVKITDQDNHTVQFRSIGSYYAGSGYWRIYGDDIEYDPNHTYVYELVPGTPGEVTYEQIPSDYHNDRVYDRNFDWSTVASWTDFESLYRHKILEVYAGTNAGLQREIYSRSSDYGYWRLANGFPVPCDYTTRYRILGSFDDNKYARGGNHPDSKMYQAKLALQKFLTSGAITTTDTDSEGTTTTRYLMNIGFATFLQARIPRTRARYYRKHGIAHPAEYIYYYRYYTDKLDYVNLPNNDGSLGCNDGNNPPTNPPASVDFDAWGHTYSNMSVGDVVDRLYRQRQCDQQTIRYKITSIVCAPSDGQSHRIRINLAAKTNFSPDSALAGTDPDGHHQWGYTRYTWRAFPDNGQHDCTTYTPPDPDGKYHLVGSTKSCYHTCRYNAAWTETPYYQTTWTDTWGDLKVTDPTKPHYIKTNSAPTDNYIVTPYKGYCLYTDANGNNHENWNCPSPDPEDTSGDGIGDWTLLDHDLTNVPVNNDGDLGDISSEIFDYSRYQYPGRTGDDDHPHGWSYKRTQRNPDWLATWHYRKDDGTYLDDDHFIYRSGSSWNYLSVWPDSIQPDPYFPSTSADDFSNYQGDDQVVFVDLPAFNDSDANKGDDVSGNNIQKVLNYIQLNRVEYPADRRYVWTMAPINKKSLTVNEYEAQAGVGTPLAATLADARKYLQSYMQQDEYSLGGCRKNYVILLTDGNETAGGDPVAEAAALQNLVVNGEEHPVKVYVIGFGLDDASKQTLDDIAQAGGSALHGTAPDQHYAYFANNVDELVGILAHDITSDILGGSYGRGKASLTPGSQQGVSSDLTLYNAYFDYPVWRGHLEAWQLYPEDVYDAFGNVIHRAGSLKVDAAGNKIGVANWSDGCSGTEPDDPGAPDAGCIMAEDNLDPGSPPDGPINRRMLYTSINGTVGSRIEFDPTNGASLAALKPLLNPTHADIDGDGTADTDLDAKTIINYIHHPGFDEKKYVGTRDENWPLADIYNSGPILVTPPRQANCLDNDGDGVLDPGSWPSMDGYCVFAENHKNRDGMVYLGTNGGMIEAITSGESGAALTGGREKWGYIPSFVLPKLQEIKEGHRFTMDLTVMASEVDTSDGLDGSGWKTMVVAGQRKGGNHYVALDVTDPDNPQPMWEFSDPNLGKSWSRPEVARIEIAGVKQSVLVFGGGYLPDADIGNRIFIVKAADGTLLKEITVGSRANNIPGRVTLIPYLVDNTGHIVDYRTNLAKLPDGTPVDYSDRYNFIEVGYFGDTSGAIWRLDGLNSKTGEAWNPHVTRLYQPDSDHARPIFYAPVITDIKKGNIDNGVVTGCVKRYILAGTGDEMDPIATKKSDFSPLIDYFFEVEDTGDTNDATDETYLDWRFSLGKQLPLDQYGFLLKPDGSRALKDTDNDGIGDKEILSKYIYLANPDDGYSINLTGHLVNSSGEIVALPGDFLYVNTDGDIFTDAGRTNKIADGGTYVQVDTSLWLTDVNDWFYDSEDGIPILDTSGYVNDNDGHWTIGGNPVKDDGSVCDPNDPAGDVCTQLVTDPGEKVLSEAVGYGRYIYFTTYSPAGGCSAGTSYFYGLKTSSCDVPGGSGTLHYNKVGEGLVPGPRRRTRLGQGISPGVTLGGGTAYVPLYSPGNPPEVNAIPVTVGETKLRYWKQN